MWRASLVGPRRFLSVSSARNMRVVFETPDKGRRVVEGEFAGKNLLDVARAGSIDLEGACDGSCACSTCHVILDRDVYEALPPAKEEEEDMLDLAFGLTETSRLGCQVKVEAQHDGITVRLPAATRNLYVDGHTPKPH
jgi:ferredoxin